MNENFGEIDSISTRIDGLPIKELIFRVVALEECESSFESSVAHFRVEEFDISQKIMLKLFSYLIEDFRE